ncbi:MAG: iron chelate uptake ABC transporter family permease subunit [Microbacterium sp.]|uniref:FecCD family ABC transporter permease n=1 Tax=Microbacterium sp. TaxID=51671 RepID=UPI0039E578FE
MTSRRRWSGVLVVTAALLLAVAASCLFGSNPLSAAQVWRALWHPDGSEAAIIVWQSRIPRTAAGLVTGAAFGVAGALIQALTRNPLADPGILGVNAGARFAVTLGISLSGAAWVGGYVWFAFAGAVLATVLVYAIGSAGRAPASPAGLVLAGIALSAVLTGASSLLALIDADTFQAIQNWGLGSIAQIGWPDLLAVLPYLVAGLLTAFLISGPLNVVALGDELASSLGANVRVVRVVGIVAVTLLAGGATALTGGLTFVGLMVPHAVRWFTGPDQRWIIAFTALASPVLVLGADVVGRVIAYPGEIQVGVVAAVLGAPALIVLVRRRRASGL